MRNLKTGLHVTWFDLEDAFGSISHKLIPVCLDRMHIPANVRDYIVALYGNLRGKVRMLDWVTEEFSFNKGVFQGDPLSPIIFICFNPILEELGKFKESDGYNLELNCFITLPFADDFNLITRDVRKHRKLMKKLFDLTTSMGLKLKPRKCKSLSVVSGKSREVSFALGNDDIGSILHEKFHKFLGGFYTFKSSSGAVTEMIRDKISDQLKNIDKLLVRNEYKVRIYADYLLGANRFLFSIHDLCSSQIESLETLTHVYLKKWLGIPKGGTWALVHDPHGLGIKSIRHIYLESRALSLSAIRCFSDGGVRHALDVKEEREGQWSRKFSSATYVKELLEEVAPPAGEVQVPLSNSHTLDDSFGSSISDPEGDALSSVAEPPRAVPSSKNALKGKIQRGINQRVSDFWRERVGQYVTQGDYLALHMEEQSCLTWKSFMWDIPQGVLKFAINAGINTFPSADNLKRWGKRVSDRCGFCGNVQTLAHILSNCSTALEQGRFTWRHDSVLNSIVSFSQSHLREGFSLFSDLSGFQAPHGGVIPPHILATSLRPDIFVVNELLRVIVILELTCPWERNIEKDHDYKERKYAPLVADLARDFQVFQFSLEVSARGLITKENKSRLKAFLLKICDVGNCDMQKLISYCSKASLLASFSIFSARNEPSWSSPRPLLVQR